jgi:hypothetical protein
MLAPLRLLFLAVRRCFLMVRRKKPSGAYWRRNKAIKEVIKEHEHDAFGQLLKSKKQWLEESLKRDLAYIGRPELSNSGLIKEYLHKKNPYRRVYSRIPFRTLRRYVARIHPAVWGGKRAQKELAKQERMRGQNQVRARRLEEKTRCSR